MNTETKKELFSRLCRGESCPSHTLYVYELDLDKASVFFEALVRAFPKDEIYFSNDCGIWTLRIMCSNQENLLEIRQSIFNEFQENFISDRTGNIEEILHERFIFKKWTLALAESCTGGSLAQRFTALPRCSSYFLGSIVSYSNSVKEKVLHVDPEVLQEEGAVSRQVALQMLGGVLSLTKADYGIAITGLAGPKSAADDLPVGSMWCAFGTKEIPLTEKFTVRGDRLEAIKGAVNHLLNALWKLTNKQL